MFGSSNERQNLDIVHTICDELDRLRPRPGGRPRTSFPEGIRATIAW